MESPLRPTRPSSVRIWRLAGIWSVFTARARRRSKSFAATADRWTPRFAIGRMDCRRKRRRSSERGPQRTECRPTTGTASSCAAKYVCKLARQLPAGSFWRDLTFRTTLESLEVGEMTSWRSLLACAFVVLHALPGLAQAKSEREGQHDFDFEIGTWKTHVRRLVRPLTGSTTWTEMNGTTIVRKVWNGRGNLVELVADGPAG